MSEPIYKVRQRILVYETALYSVFSDALVDKYDELIAPNYLVVEPKNQTPEGVGGVVIIPYLDGKVGLVHVFRHATGQFGWEAPRGFVDEGETPDIAALRELKEEVGLLCDVNHLHDMGYAYPDPGIVNARIQCFVAKECSLSDEKPDGEFGHREFRFFSPVEVDQMIRDDEVQDSITVVAYFRSQPLKTGLDDRC